MADRLKDIFFTPTSINTLADHLGQVYPEFHKTAFLTLVFDETWDGLELKARMRHITRCLGQTLPGDYAHALAILTQVAPHIQGFDAMLFPDFVEVYGLGDWERSLPALAFFTRFGSSEFAIRPFLAQDPTRALASMRRWASDDNEHVRRLASEGCRPRLPWAMALPQFKADPQPILPILETLKDDGSEYVRRSVANNLNDISKDHPDVVLALCQRWYGQSERTDGIVKHALRGLLKAGHPTALALFGFEDGGEVEVRGLRLDKTELRIGDELTFAFELHVTGDSNMDVRLEYTIAFVKASGKPSKKVFQLSEKRYAPGVYTLQKRHSFVDRTTRKHYPGEHHVAIIANGKEQASAAFTLTAT